MARRQLLIFGIVFLLAGGSAASRSRRKDAGSRAAAPFDYYLLTLSWAPDFCAAPGGVKDPRECGAGRHIRFVVHGLWPQSNNGRGPENCGSASPVSKSIVALMLHYIPTESLIQHEWSTHGSCTGLTADAYFALVRQARDGVQIPAVFTSLTQQTSESAAQVETQFAMANPAYPKTAFRATCTNGMLQEARLCFDKNLTAQACTASAGECTAAAMTILPPK
ncbi:MAG: ribonuclease T2 [Acidobacteriota bacterium]